MNKDQLNHRFKIRPFIFYTNFKWTKFGEAYSYEIDNNLIENSIRPVALGRKNYIFAGSQDAVQRAAMMYSFFATCKLNSVEPQAWLTISDHIAPPISD